MAAGLKTIIRRWQDVLPLLFFSIVVPAAIVDWLGAAATMPALVAVSGAGASCAALIASMVRRRLDFFAGESLFAAEALMPREVLAYRLAWHLPAALLLLALVALGKPLLLPHCVAGYAVGLLCAEAAGVSTRVLRRSAARWLRRSRSAARWRSRPDTAAIASLSGAGALMLLPVILGTGAELSFAVAGITVTTLALVSPIRASEIQFQSAAGWRLRSSLRIALRFAGIALALLMAATLLLGLPALAAIAAGAGLCVLVLRTAQVMAHRCFRRRMAEIVLTVLIGSTMIIGGLLPPLLPFAAAAGLLWLGRRARRSTWLLT
ncbi:hypothetical protein [Sphingosinicella sp. BN140058]|uniref:hypothetical protein n=1 Tax=Sphingosinicella sp. BN140058 TaxID=1892855 RepID=UPI001013881C|nr:hypothetical protein [Sphingosinicella sp. BN140058]QAY75666.1 hypothetical protein ETR14_03310 [Sphingosinicella sp. BN140058]